MQTIAEILDYTATQVENYPGILGETVTKADGSKTIPTDPDATTFDMLGLVARNIWGTTPEANDSLRATMFLLSTLGVRETLTPEGEMFYATIKVIGKGHKSMGGVLPTADSLEASGLNPWVIENGRDPEKVAKLLRVAATVA